MSTITHGQFGLVDTCTVGVSPEFSEDGIAFVIFRDLATSYNALYCTLDGGVSWEGSLNPNTGENCFRGDADSRRTEVVAVIVSPDFVEDATVVTLLSDGTVLRSTSSGSSWKVVGRLAAETTNACDVRVVLRRYLPDEPAENNCFYDCNAPRSEVSS
jgi:photosystem II stability/assembly factor-like uncharacterized protein